MGSRARKFFEKAASLGGLRGKIRLASLSLITSTEAESLVETPEVLARLERAMTTVEEELGRAAATASARPLDLSTRADTSAAYLRKHIATFLELMTQRGLFLDDVLRTFQRITEAAASTLDVARTSIWLLERGMSKIITADLFERDKPAHSAGTALLAQDFAPYFSALLEERTIAAHDARSDPRTSCFAESYLAPLGITSMLDVPIWVNHEMVGVVCHEHIGPRRTWNSDEEQFAYLMANFAALGIERARAAGK